MANFENITIEKGMYQQKGKTLTDVLETLDPSENYKGTALSNLDAFSRQLKRFDIKVNGSGSDSDMTDDDKTLKPVGEGAVIPQTKIKTRENLVKLHKRGRMLVASYEAVRFQRIDLFTVTLRRIGEYIARAQLKDAIDVLVNGDGNANPAANVDVAASGSITYDDLLKLWSQLSPYELNTIIAPTDAMQKLLSMSEMQDANAGLDFQASGRMITPLGASLLHAPEMTGSKIIGFDKNCALEMVQAGNVNTDYDKLIDRQLERAAITCTAGFSKIFADSVKTLSY